MGIMEKEMELLYYNRVYTGVIGVIFQFLSADEFDQDSRML